MPRKLPKYRHRSTDRSAIAVVAQFEIHGLSLTNAFSKKAENHAAAAAPWFMYCNFSRIHQSLRVTPAMQAGLTDGVWELTEMATLPDSPA